MSLLLPENRLHSHAKKQLKRKEPGIVQLARTYNGICSELVTLIHRGLAPRGAVAPEPIDQDGLFQLDVDDGIWQDIGLGEDDMVNVPRWLGDENVRKGIRSLLELDRCLEEEIRISKERCAMQEWMMEEWACVEAGLQTSGDYNACYLSFVILTITADDQNIIYQLQKRAQYLCELCAAWQAKVRAVPSEHDIGDCWGPSEGEIADALKFEYHGSWNIEPERAEDEQDDDSDGIDNIEVDLDNQKYDWFSSGDEENADLLEEIEVSALNYNVDLDDY